MRKKWLVWLLISLSSSAYGEELRDVRPPVSYPDSNLFYFFILVLIIGGIYYLFFKRRQGEGALPKKTPAWEVALRQLDELKNFDISSQDDYEKYYSRLSNIVRAYIEQRYSISAPQMTTQEFLYSLKNSKDFDSLQIELLNEFLSSCDLVKFARESVTPQEAVRSLETARKFVEETKLLEIS